MRGEALRRGRLVAAALAGSWRSAPPGLAVPSAALEQIAPALLRTGCSGLAQRKAAACGRGEEPGFRTLRGALRFHVLSAALRERQLGDVIARLRDVEVYPVLVKGWAVARRYPSDGMRPYGDLDLCVHPGEYPRAVAALAPRLSGVAIDLHPFVPDLPPAGWPETHARARVAHLGDTPIRVLAPEDEVRHLCVHMLRHGVRRPLWLCDLGLLMETLPGSFDWDLCLSGPAPRKEWVLAALTLAHRLLGAGLDRLPMDHRQAELPDWLPAAVLAEWGRRATVLETPPSFRTRDTLLRALQHCWPNPVKASIHAGAGFRTGSRFPAQLLHCCQQLGRKVCCGAGRQAAGLRAHSFF